MDSKKKQSRSDIRTGKHKLDFLVEKKMFYMLSILVFKIYEVFLKDFYKILEEIEHITRIKSCIRTYDRKHHFNPFKNGSILLVLTVKPRHVHGFCIDFLTKYFDFVVVT